MECRRLSDGVLVWSTQMTGITNGNLAVCGELLIVPGDSWTVWTLNRFNGAFVWNRKLTGNYARNSPFVACGKVFISACHGDFYGLNGQTGEVEWRFRHGAGFTFVEWAEADGRLYVANSHGKIFCFRPAVPGDAAFCVCDLTADGTPKPTFAPTHTPTAAFRLLPGGVSQAYPNPSRGGLVALDVDCRDPRAAVRVSLYTVSGRRIREIEPPPGAGCGRIHWDLRDETGNPVANGVFLAVVEMEGDGDGDAREVRKILVLR